MTEENKPEANKDDDLVSLESLFETTPTPAPSPQDKAAAGAAAGQLAEGQATALEYQKSQTAIDQFIAEADPDFVETLKALSEIPKSEDDVLSIGLDEELLEAEPVTRLSQFRDRIAFLLKPYYWVKYNVESIRLRVIPQVKQLLPLLRSGFKENLKKFLFLVKEDLGIAWQGFRRRTRIFTDISARRRYLLLIMASIVVFFGFFWKRILTGSFLPQSTSQFVRSFDENADREFLINFERGIEPFESPLRMSEYFVLLKRTVVNLRQGKQSGPYPIGTFEIYVEGSNQEVAVEIKDREVELVDRSSRVIEEMSFDQLSTAEGKQLLKTGLRKEFNQILNKGRVKKVLLKQVNLKP